MKLGSLLEHYGIELDKLVIVRKAAVFLLSIDVVFYAFNNLMLLCRLLSKRSFGLSMQLTILIFMSISFAILRDPSSVAWFGKKLDRNHEANLTVSYLFAVLGALAAFIFNFGSLMAGD